MRELSRKKSKAILALLEHRTVGEAAESIGIGQSDLFLFYGIPEHIRSDNGPEFMAKAVRKWLERIGVRTLFIEPGSPWENGYNESFNGKLGDEVLNRLVFYNLKEAKVIIERWRQEYNTVRPHSSLCYRSLAPETVMPLHFDPFWLSSSRENIDPILT